MPFDVAKLLAFGFAVIGDYMPMEATALAVAPSFGAFPRGDGYGLSPALVKQAADCGAKTLLTVDRRSMPLMPSVRQKLSGMTMLMTIMAGDEADWSHIQNRFFFR